MKQQASIHAGLANLGFRHHASCLPCLDPPAKEGMDTGASSEALRYSNAEPSGMKGVQQQVPGE
ncbi:MAG: hypothetical protein RBU29_00780 [bacterium]|nr:hypothetical protein [bacterium]